MDLRRAWAERQAAWARYRAWEESHTAYPSLDEAAASVGALIDQFVPPRPSPVLSDDALRVSVRGPIELRRILARARI